MQFKLKLSSLRVNLKGTSLLEIITAVTIFIFIVLMAVGIFQAVIEGQRSAINAQNMQESIRYAMETITKEIRGAKKSDGACKSLFSPEPVPAYKVFNTAVGGALYFKNKNDECTAYFLELNRFKIKRGSNSDFITPDEIKISNLKFIVKDDNIGASHSIQPAVTIEMDVEALGKVMNKQSMKIQTTISARYYE